uniref:HotDog ACOT-type domain-containing protein n=2 Tax=Clytia hemisphaerica TaxID=252671 RepID=A0A7M5XKY2_9CNID
MSDSKFFLFRFMIAYRRFILQKEISNMFQPYRNLNLLVKRCFTSSVTRLAYRDVTKDHPVIVGSKQLRKLLQEHVGAKKFWLENIAELSNIDAERAKKQEDLVPRSSKDSVQEVIIPLGSDLVQREKYLTFYNTVRFGKLLEDLDTLAGWVGFKYFKGPTERAPFSLVTACVDKINLQENTISSTEDIKLTGFISWAGRTSLEITSYVDQFDPETGTWKRLSDAVFVMVARSLKDGSATFVNKFVPTNDEEKKFFEQGELNVIERKRKSAESLFKQAPTAEERNLIHQMFLGSLDPSKSTFSRRVKPDNTVWMEYTRLKNLLICHPQARNLYNKIFGGFLMREAFELAWANTCTHIKSRPTVIAMDDVMFRKPVEVGSLLYLSSEIVYSKDTYLLTRVHAEVVDPKTGDIDTTNVFYFHFTSKKEFPQVAPMSYGEYMLYLDGLRHANALRIPEVTN